MKIEVRYSWRTTWAGRTVTSKIKMTEEQARAQHPGAVRLASTREEVLVRDQPCEIDQANIELVSNAGRTQPRLSRLYRPKTVPQEQDFVPVPLRPERYRVSREGDIWTVESIIGDHPRLVYQGRGPVWVEAAP